MTWGTTPEVSKTGDHRALGVDTPASEESGESPFVRCLRLGRLLGPLTPGAKTKNCLALAN